MVGLRIQYLIDPKQNFHILIPKSALLA